MLAKMDAAVGARAGDVICFGHTHKPWERTVGGVLFVNTGSVNRPKNGDPRAGYVVLDITSSAVTAQVVRVKYNVGEAAAGIPASTLPHEFAD